MEFGIQFFPAVDVERHPPAAYFEDCLQLSTLADSLGWGHIRTVEHYFHPYGGYSPNPIVFLAAAAQRTKRARLITGAVLPVFNHPLKLAGEIGMLDAISGGRLEIGFARAFLPHEFTRFEVSVDESRARFTEGMEQIRLLLEQENVTSEGKFHRFRNTTSYPRPTQKPRPPFWIAATATPESFAAAGRAGHSVMVTPMSAAKLAEVIGLYRESWRSAGHAGIGRVMLAFHMFCDDSRDRAYDIAREPMNRYFKILAEAASDWSTMRSADYPGYDKIIVGLGKETFETQLAAGSAWVGTPADIADRVAHYAKIVSGFESASLQVNFNSISRAEAEHSVLLFSEKVMPKFQS